MMTLVMADDDDDDRRCWYWRKGSRFTAAKFRNLFSRFTNTWSSAIVKWRKFSMRNMALRLLCLDMS